MIGEMGIRGALVALAATMSIALAACGGSDVSGFDVEGAQDLAKDVSGRNVSEEDSLYLAANLEPALGELRGRVGDQATVDMKIEAGSLKLEAQPPGGEAQSVVIGASGNAFQTPIGGFQVTGPPLTQIDPGAVERIARQVSAEAGVPLLGINYFATLTGTEPFTWGIYLKDGRRWEANLDGSGVKRVT